MVHMLLDSKGEVYTDKMPIRKSFPVLFIQFLTKPSKASFSWTRYEMAPYVPSNFVAIGDAVMRVNPVFGFVLSKIASLYDQKG